MRPKTKVTVWTTARFPIASPLHESWSHGTAAIDALGRRHQLAICALDPKGRLSAELRQVDGHIGERTIAARLQQLAAGREVRPRHVPGVPGRPPRHSEPAPC